MHIVGGIRPLSPPYLTISFAAYTAWMKNSWHAILPTYFCFHGATVETKSGICKDAVDPRGITPLTCASLSGTALSSVCMVAYRQGRLGLERGQVWCPLRQRKATAVWLLWVLWSYSSGAERFPAASGLLYRQHEGFLPWSLKNNALNLEIL